MEECGIVRSIWRGCTIVCICRRCEMIPIAAVAVAIAITFDYWFSKLKEAQTPIRKARLRGCLYQRMLEFSEKPYGSITIAYFAC